MAAPTELIFGLRPIIEAIQSGQTVDKLLLQRGLQGDIAQELIALCKEYDVVFQTVPVEKLNRLTRKNHQGCIALISPIPFQRIEDLLPQFFEAGQNPLLLVLDGVTDTRNFGAIVRTAECAGVQAVVIPTKGAARVSSDAVKTSAGALFKVPVCKAFSMKETLLFLQNSGLQLVACTEKTDESYLQPDYSLPTAIVMGSEEDGIAEPILRQADHRASLPLHGKIGSLNVSVATGIILYEALRQRQLAS